jgi:response regulator RpfG family c-di-GMP phosphodiesterase
LFRLIIWQCSQAMRNKIEAIPDYKKLEKEVNFVELLKRMKEIVDGTDNTQYQFWKMQAQLAKLVFIFMKKEPSESVASYQKRFEDLVEAVESVFGTLVPTFDMEHDPTTEQMQKRNKLLACLFLANSDRERFKTVIDDLGNEFQFGKINYPEDVGSMS